MAVQRHLNSWENFVRKQMKIYKNNKAEYAVQT